MAMDTVQKYVDIPIDHYVSINMKGLKELVDAVGGIEVNNDLTFSQDGYDFTIGKITLNGDQALSDRGSWSYRKKESKNKRAWTKKDRRRCSEKSIESKRCQQLSIRFECSRIEYENRHEL
ncbi:hypothetical protein EfmAA610_20770 [Enterococcus faecium]|nr:hypothetical protein EfmAA610_20770 [Enterococcus faecium]